MGHTRVLIVDDEPDEVELLAIVLEQLGYETSSAMSGAEALVLARERRPHVILLDIGLPDLSGYDVARTIRSWDGGAAPYIAAVTGWAREEHVEAALGAGIDEHLTKPLSFAQIEKLLATATARQVLSLEARRSTRVRPSR